MWNLHHTSQPSPIHHLPVDQVWMVGSMLGMQVLQISYSLQLVYRGDCWMIFRLWSGRYLGQVEKTYWSNCIGFKVSLNKCWTNTLSQDRLMHIFAASMENLLGSVLNVCQGCPAGYFKDGEGDLVIFKTFFPNAFWYLSSSLRLFTINHFSLQHAFLVFQESRN